MKFVVLVLWFVSFVMVIMVKVSVEWISVFMKIFFWIIFLIEVIVKGEYS